MPINTPTGYLDITNATLRGSKIVTTGYVGIANANPTNHLSIGSNLHINDTHSNVLQISGNINAASVVLGGISIAPTFDLEVITNTGNTTPNTLEFNNAATAFVTTANATIGDTLTASKLVGDGSGISAIQSSNVTDFGSNVSRITTLETDLGNNSTRITNLSSNLSDNSTRISTLSSDLSDNSTRITNLSSNLSDNSTRITNLSSNLSDNSSRITALESGDISISGDKTFTGDVIFESNIHMNGNVLVANTINMTVSDPIIELGSNNLNTNDLGIIMTRHGATNSNIALVYDESDDILRMGYTLNGASDSIISLDSNALSMSVQGALSAASVTTDDYLIHGGDTDTKVGFPLADTFTVTTSNSERLRVDSSGNVGVGAAPTGKFQVNIGNASAETATWDNTKVVFGDISAGNSQGLGFGVATNSHASIISLAPSVAWRGLSYWAADHNWYGGGLHRMILNSSGNLGIGTTSPQGALHVAGNSGSSNTSKALGVHMGVYSSAYAHIEIVCSGSNTGWIDFKNANTTGNGDHTDRIRGGSGHLEFITNQTERVRINSSGNVGIGTASPGEKLHVHENLSTSGHQIAARIGGTASSTYSTLVFGSKEGRPHIGGHKGDYGAWHDLSLQNDLMILKQSNMRVGIGTTTPDAPLHIFKAGGNAGDVGGGIKMERWDNYGCAIWSQYPSGGTVDCMAFRVANNATDAYGGTPQMVLTHEGRIGIGTTDPSSKFHVNGRIRSDQPRFFAYDTRSAINFSGGATLALNTTHYNSGSHYSTSTGYFTAPVNGVYYFHVSFFTYTTMQFAWKLVPTAGSTSYNNMRVTRNNNTGGDDVLIQTTSVSGQFSGSISLYLSTNEKFGWGSRNQSGSFYGRHSHFSGYLLSEV